METIYEYSQRVFNYAQSNDYDESKLFIGSCASQKMHRFTHNLKIKVKFDDNEIKKFAIFCFSLLFNFIDLTSFDFIIENII